MKKTLLASVVGAVLGFGFTAFAGTAATTGEANACGRMECRTDRDCTKVCGGLVAGSCVQVDSCNTRCYCAM